MTDEDRDRLRERAKDTAKHGPRPALDAIALWTLLAEPTCLLCGAEREEYVCCCGDCPYSTMPGPDAGSVLCSRCRSYPTGRRG